MKYKGLTLVELIVVIAIIAVLIAITFPGLHTSRQYAKMVLCDSNIRQIVLGLSMYESENQTFPFGLDSLKQEKVPIRFNTGDGNWYWINFLEGYLDRGRGNHQVACCPSKNMKNTSLRKKVLSGNYGVNQSICTVASFRGTRPEFTGRPLCSSSVSSPSAALLVADSGYGLINWWHVTEYPPGKLRKDQIADTSYLPGMEINERKQLWPGTEEDAIKGRHKNKSINVGFVDCHVENIEANKLCVEKTQTGYKNRSPLWSPR